MKRREVAERLWARVAKGAPDECWPWLGYCRPSGHGQISDDGGRLDGTHRVAWESANGPIPSGILIRHTCDNPPCCNPAHLLPGTRRDNAQDAVARGQIAREFRQPGTKLSDADVACVRANYRFDPAHRKSNSHELAARFGVAHDHITRIVRGDRRRTT